MAGERSRGLGVGDLLRPLERGTGPAGGRGASDLRGITDDGEAVGQLRNLPKIIPVVRRRVMRCYGSTVDIQFVEHKSAVLRLISPHVPTEIAGLRPAIGSHSVQ